MPLVCLVCLLRWFGVILGFGGYFFDCYGFGEFGCLLMFDGLLLILVGLLFWICLYFTCFIVRLRLLFVYLVL